MSGSQMNRKKAEATLGGAAWRRSAALQLPLAVGAMLALSLPCAAADVQTPATFAEPSAYRVEVGDKLMLTVFGQPEFTGELSVDATGDVSVPFVGEIEVKNQTLAECRKTIAARLAGGFLVNAAIDVRMQEFRPIYVTGDVKSPGAFAFRYGSTVMSAIAMAGGLGVATLNRSTAMVDYLTAREQSRDLHLQRLELALRRARLEAQRDGASTFTTAAAADPIDKVDATELAAVELQNLLAERSALTSQLDLLRSQKPRIAREIESLRAQKAVEEEQATAIHSQSQQYTSLVQHGLGLATQDLQFKLEETTRRSDILRLAAEISRLETDSGDIDIKIVDAQSAFSLRTNIELADIRQKQKQVDIALQASSEIADLKRQFVGDELVDRAPRPIFVSRNVDGHVVTLPATGSTTLAPGDIVEIKTIIESDAPGVSSGEASHPEAHEALAVKN